MAATSVPQLIAYAETAGYAGYRGLSTAGPPLLAWGLTTGSPFMTAGVTSITALMAKTDLDGDSYSQQHGEDSYVRLVAAYSVCVGLASLLLAVFGFGRLAQQVPASVRKGFKWGCAVGVLVSAVPSGLFMGGKGELKQMMASSEFGQAVSDIKTAFPAATGAVSVSSFVFALLNPALWGIPCTLLFVACTVFVKSGPKILPKFLPPGTEVVLATAAATLYSVYFAYEGGVVGEIPVLGTDDGSAGTSLMGGKIRLPIEILDPRSLVNDIPVVVDRFGGSWVMMAISATLFAAVNFLSIMGIASGFESEDGVAWSAPRELFAQGMSCFVAALVGSAPVSGSLSRSLVNRMTGATSQAAVLVNAIVWIYLLPYMSVMSPTPKAALGAVIVSAVLKGVLVPKDLMKLQGLDWVVGWTTGILTALTSPTIGFGAGLLFYFITSVFRSKDNQNAKKTKQA